MTSSKIFYFTKKGKWVKRRGIKLEKGKIYVRPDGVKLKWRGKQFIDLEKERQYQTKYSQTETYKLARKNYHQTETYKLARKRYQQTEKYKLAQKRYQKKYNKSYKYKLKQRRYYQSDHGKFRESVSGRLRTVLKRANADKNTNTINYLGCTIADCRKHLEKQFQPDMNWENHSKTGWHIDHRKPCASFDFSDEEQKYMCFHYTNLQPMWASQNISKGCKFNEDTFEYEWKGREIGWVKKC